jgi:glycerophosphoryl diester phosphodiesterase
VPPTTPPAPAATYGTMFPSIFGTIFYFISRARLPSLTAITWALKIANVSTANIAIIFVSLFKTHGLEQIKSLLPENATIRKR